MGNIELLDKTRKINKLLHNNKKSKVVFDDMCVVMKDILSSNVICLSKKGKVLGLGLGADEERERPIFGTSRGDFINEVQNERLLGILSTKENVNLETLGFEEEKAERYKALITPIDIGGNRLGTLFFYRCGDDFTIEDIILCEYGATVVSLEMLRSVREEDEMENRMSLAIEGALSALSYSEKEAVIRVFDELGGCEGIVVASRIADQSNITRSVIVNALRKFESAGIIEARSSGMKGTYIRVLNPQVYVEIEELKHKTV
ncbi:MAG: GTP-sensing pleiotropic transcriptional regulator CodY [Lachnospiraceae bacterium]|nr:GTP-sensing pleiotropic transcriptional regulator CodY [Lachnospiraceae bacterium]